MSGVDSSVILVNLTNDTKIANKAIVTGIIIVCLAFLESVFMDGLLTLY